MGPQDTWCHHSREKRQQALSYFSTLEGIESCTGPGNEASFSTWLWRSSLVTSPCMPPDEKRSGERNQISWAYYPKAVRTNETARSVITKTFSHKIVMIRVRHVYYPVDTCLSYASVFFFFFLCINKKIRCLFSLLSFTFWEQQNRTMNRSAILRAVGGRTEHLYPPLHPSTSAKHDQRLFHLLTHPRFVSQFSQPCQCQDTTLTLRNFLSHFRFPS